MKPADLKGKELKTLWVLCVFVEGKFRDTVCVSIEMQVALDLATQGNANAKAMGAPVEFVLIETLTDHAFTAGLHTPFFVTVVDPSTN